MGILDVFELCSVCTCVFAIKTFVPYEDFRGSTTVLADPDPQFHWAVRHQGD